MPDDNPQTTPRPLRFKIAWSIRFIALCAVGSMGVMPPEKVPLQISLAILWFVAGMATMDIWKS